MTSETTEPVTVLHVALYGVKEDDPRVAHLLKAVDQWGVVSGTHIVARVDRSFTVEVPE